MANEAQRVFVRDDPRVAEIVDVIVRASSPDKVILFGSRARGDARTESDYDFLVVKKGVVNEREVSSTIYRALYRYPELVSVDVVVVDEEKFIRRKHEPGLVYQEADSQGIVVYG